MIWNIIVFLISVINRYLEKPACEVLLKIVQLIRHQIVKHHIFFSFSNSSVQLDSDGPSIYNFILTNYFSFLILQ